MSAKLSYIGAEFTSPSFFKCLAATVTYSEYVLVVSGVYWF